ncbi:MAG TPA: SUMF1/EgtB/PvdO family nonheme iron enzyme [Gemmataceae bacterium]|nr:SUMF1/EgtB/PvdO family nonheme iron enzyme [Gemmataceae bacterium]
MLAAVLGGALLAALHHGPRDTGQLVRTAPSRHADVPRPAPLDCTSADGVSAAEVRQAQEVWAKYLGREIEETVEIANGVKMTFVIIPPGKFRMGSPEGEDGRFNDETLHEVTLSEPFDLGKTEVTQAQYQALTGNNPSNFKGADLPVEQVSWERARDYATWLMQKRDDQHTYRLPTEAEWEYSCRGGRPFSKPFGIGDATSLSSDQANFNGNRKQTCPVGSYPANALGLFDMHGNVWEWCADRYGLYLPGNATNPTGPAQGSVRILRGGCWICDASRCRAAVRDKREPGWRRLDLGFRLARSSPSGGK